MEKLPIVNNWEGYTPDLKKYLSETDSDISYVFEKGSGFDKTFRIIRLKGTRRTLDFIINLNSINVVVDNSNNSKSCCLIFESPQEIVNFFKEIFKNVSFYERYTRDKKDKYIPKYKLSDLSLMENIINQNVLCSC